MLVARLAVLLLALAPLTPLAAQQDSTRRTQGLPLEASARSFRLSTDRGTWISLDVTPDGQRIVFDLLGDLYSMPMAGGRATRITSGLAFDAQPRVSPDGQKIVFVSDRSGSEHVWTVNIDGTSPTQLTRGDIAGIGSPEWTPDGQGIVVSRSAGQGGPKLWLYHKDGGSGLQMTRDPAARQFLGAAFGPDARYVWYGYRDGGFSYNLRFPSWQVGVYDREAGTHTTMTSRQGSAFRPALSPDGKYLTYATRFKTESGLLIRELATGTERWLRYPVQRDDQEGSSSLDVLPGYAWTPNSREVVLSYAGEIWRVPVEGGDPIKVPFRVEEDIAVGPVVNFQYRVDTGDVVARQIRDAVPSPDGRRLAFSALGKIYVMDYPSGTPSAVAPDLADGQHYPVWSPDGSALAFASWDDRVGGAIYRVNMGARRSAPQRLTRASARFAELAWAPDGRRIVAMRAATRDMQETLERFGLGLGAEFVWVPATGGEVTVIAPSGGRRAPHFGPDSSRIYIYGGEDGLVSMRWDGTDVRGIVKVTGPAAQGSTNQPQASLIRIAPRGDQALAQVGNQLYVVTIPLIGGQTPTISVANVATAPFPARRLTDIGGEFPTWDASGRRVHWSLGNAHVVYDLERAKALDDSLRTAGRDSTPRDSAARNRPRVEYKPVETRLRVTMRRDIPNHTVLLRGARAITMRGQEVIENADIVVRNDRIVSVGPRGEVPAGARVIDVSGKTIVPGYVDTHAHYRHSPGIHFGQPWAYLATLSHGVTTARDPQTATTDVLSYSDLVEAGRMVGPRVYSTGPGVFAGENIRSLDDARNVLRRYAQYYDTKTLKMYGAGNRQVRQWIIMAARELQLMPTTEGGIDYALELTHALDGYSGVEHSLTVYPILPDVVRLFTETRTYNTPTLLVAYGGPWAENFYYATERVADDPKLMRFMPDAELDARARRRGGNPGQAGFVIEEEHIFPKHAEFMRDLLAAGGGIGVGSHGQLQGLAFHWELWSIQSGGMTRHDALRAATIVGAEAIGLGTDLGSIEPGKLADLVVLNSNPLEDIKRSKDIRYVMRGGRLYDGDTLDEVAPTARALPQQVWQGTRP